MVNITDLAKALYAYFNQFGNAYVNNSVPNGTKFPYITYTVEDISKFNNNIMQIMVYSKSNSFTEITSICDKILNDVGDGKVIPVFGKGCIYLEQGSPSCQLINDVDDITMKTALINIEYKVY